MSNAQKKETIAPPSDPSAVQNRSLLGSENQFQRGLREYVRSPEFKVLLENLRFRQKAANVKTIAILAEKGGDLKVSMAAALALGYGDLFGEKTLVIDSDYRRAPNALTPAMALGVSEAPRVLGGALHTLSEKVDLLHVVELMTGGNRQAGGGFDLSKESIRGNYGTIFVDGCSCLFGCGAYGTCPTGFVNHDESGAVLVVSQEARSEEWMKAAAERLQYCGFKMIGIVGDEGGV